MIQVLIRLMFIIPITITSTLGKLFPITIIDPKN